VSGNDRLTVWELLREYAATQSGPFTSQEALSWFRRHAPSTANDQTVRTHVRGACWNVGDRSQFAHREPFLTRLDRGLFRRATSDEILQWRAQQPVRFEERRKTARTVGDQMSAAVPGGAGLTAEPALPMVEPLERLEAWHTEASVQASLVTALAAEGWRILSVANTATREHGIDVIASRAGRTVGIEVKGFPSRGYADPARADEVKRTSPSTQAGHWYSQAVLAAMRLRGKEPGWRSVIALPDFPRYRDLQAETAGSLAAAQIEVWWLDQAGAVHRP
jgi:Holliday junction resolvase-like predicted endonuclease